MAKSTWSNAGLAEDDRRRGRGAEDIVVPPLRHSQARISKTSHHRWTQKLGFVEP